MARIQIPYFHFPLLLHTMSIILSISLFSMVAEKCVAPHYKAFVESGYMDIIMGYSVYLAHVRIFPRGRGKNSKLKVLVSMKIFLPAPPPWELFARPQEGQDFPRRGQKSWKKLQNWCPQGAKLFRQILLKYWSSRTSPPPEQVCGGQRHPWDAQQGPKLQGGQRPPEIPRGGNAAPAPPPVHASVREAYSRTMKRKSHQVALKYLKPFSSYASKFGEPTPIGQRVKWLAVLFFQKYTKDLDEHT